MWDLPMGGPVAHGYEDQCLSWAIRVVKELKT